MHETVTCHDWGVEDLQDTLDKLAEHVDFSGVARVNSEHRQAQIVRGLADRSNERPIHATTRFAVASGTKGLTALTIMSLVDTGELTLATPVRALLGDVLPKVDAQVTIEHLVTHRSGIGDYLDEELLGDIDDYVFGSTSGHVFQRPSDYLDLLRTPDQVCRPGERFAYSNSGFVLLSIVIETVTGSFHQAVQDRVFGPAGMSSSGFFRTDDLPADTALGYLKDGRTNQFHLPVIGAGDGGAFTTLDDVDSLWHAFTEHRVVSADSVRQMSSLVSDRVDKASYGRGLWMNSTADHLWLEGMDAGVSFQTGFHRPTNERYCVMSNTSSGVWPLVDQITAGFADRK